MWQSKLKNLFLVVYFFYVCDTTNAQKLEMKVKLPGLDWETQLETGLIALEANCDQSLVPFNREEMRNEIKQCLHKIMNEDPTNVYQVLTNPRKRNPPTQIDVFRHIYIEPICNKVSKSLGCLQPHKIIIESCARDDGRALQQLMEVTCRGNGSRLVEFLEAGGVDCAIAVKDPLVSCFAVTVDGKMNLTSSDEVCSYFRKSRACIMKALNQCDNKKPGEILESLIEDVIAEKKGNCFSSNLYTSSTSSIQNSKLSVLQALVYFILLGLYLRK